MQELQEQDIEPVDRIPMNELTAEDMCGARELQAARAFFMTAARRKFITYRKGVDLCRQVIRQCPDSENAESARDLLRRSVPEDQREKYKLTDEELGL